MSFEDVEAEIVAGRFIGSEDNPSHPGQRRIIVRLRDYPHVVPFVIDESGDWFLKTIIPSRRARKEGRKDMTYPDGIILDPEEQAFEDAYDESVPAPEAERAALIAAAKEGRRPLSIRLDSADLAALKRLAEREGLPYQTLLSSIVHKYVSGTLVDLVEARKLLREAP